MPLNIIELTLKESELLAQMAFDGFAEDRDLEYKRLDIYNSWRKVYDGYVVLAITGELEALKRALFLQWYAHSEPSWLNGLIDLSLDSQRVIINLITEKLEKEALDEELKWMLPYYFQIAEFYLPQKPEYERLRKFSAVKNGDQWINGSKDKSRFINRGQFGKYWSSIKVEA